MKNQKCSLENGFCHILKDFFENNLDDKGFHNVLIVNNDFKMMSIGAGYKSEKKGKPTIMNYCPWCGGKVNWVKTPVELY